MSNDKSSSSSSGGIGVFGLLGVVFVTLKLLGITDVATWSWWWVTVPLWGGLAVFLVFLRIVVVFATLRMIFTK